MEEFIVSHYMLVHITWIQTQEGRGQLVDGIEVLTQG